MVAMLIQTVADQAATIARMTHTNAQQHDFIVQLTRDLEATRQAAVRGVGSR